MESGGVVLAGGLLIGLAYGAVGLVSGFCLLSGLRGWSGDGDGRLIRAYALALGVAIAGTQLLAACGLVEFGKTIYLQSAFSAPMIFLGGALFGYGMVLANGCGSLQSPRGREFSSGADRGRESCSLAPSAHDGFHLSFSGR